MSREHCPNCYLRAKESGYVDLYTLEREEDGTLVCPSCGEEYTDSEVDEKWYDIELKNHLSICQKYFFDEDDKEKLKAP